MNALLGLVAIGGALVASRRSRRTGLGAPPQPEPGLHTSEAMGTLLRAAGSLYEPVDRLRAGPTDFQWEDPSYTPACEAFANDADEALYAAMMAENEGEPQAYSTKVAAVQAWALSRIECPDAEVPDWAKDQAERPLTPG